MNCIAGTFIAVALALCIWHEDVDGRSRLWLCDGEEQEEKLHARSQARASVLRGLVSLWSPCAALYLLLQHDQLGASLRVFFWFLFLGYPPSHKIILRITFFYCGIMEPSKLVASLFLPMPHTVFWVACFAIPISLCIVMESLAQHLALALWGIAFMLLCLRSPEMIATSAILHTVMFGISLALKMLQESSRVNLDHSQLHHTRNGMLCAVPMLFLLLSVLVAPSPCSLSTLFWSHDALPCCAAALQTPPFFSPSLLYSHRLTTGLQLTSCTG